MQTTHNGHRIGGVSQQVRENPLPTPADGSRVPSGGVPADLIASWTHRLTRKNLSPNTIRLYVRTVEAFSKEVPDFLYADEVAVQAWLDSKPGKAGTTNNRISALTSFYRWAKRNKLRLDNPCDDLEKPKADKGIPKPIRNVAAVLDEMDELDRKANLWGAVPRTVGETRAMATVLLNTGLRIHEAVALSVPVPCPDRVTLIGKGKKEAVVRFNAKARAAMNFLGGSWPITARATQRRFEKVTVERVTPHKFRHTFATNLLRSGQEIGMVSKLCRHSSPAVTMVYAEYADSAMDEAIDGL